MIFTAILGLVTGLLPELLKYLNKRADNAHEIEMFRLEMQGQELMHRDAMEQINAEADIQEDATLHAPQQSFGVQILDKMHESGMSPWLITPMLYIYTFLDLLQAIVRPGITLAITGFYMYVKWAQYAMLNTVSDPDKWYDTILKLWTSDDMAVFVLVLSYWFGNRMAQKAFANKKVGWN